MASVLDANGNEITVGCRVRHIHEPLPAGKAAPRGEGCARTRKASRNMSSDTEIMSARRIAMHLQGLPIGEQEALIERRDAAIVAKAKKEERETVEALIAALEPRT